MIWATWKQVWVHLFRHEAVGKRSTNQHRLSGLVALLSCIQGLEKSGLSRYFTFSMTIFKTLMFKVDTSGTKPNKWPWGTRKWPCLIDGENATKVHFLEIQRCQQKGGIARWQVVNGYGCGAFFVFWWYKLNWTFSQTVNSLLGWTALSPVTLTQANWGKAKIT